LFSTVRVRINVKKIKLISVVLLTVFVVGDQDLRIIISVDDIFEMLELGW